MIVEGGKTVYGARLGILMLETRFPRIPGDMGHAGTWPFPVRYRVVRGASPDRVVRRMAEGLLGDFMSAGRELVAEGVDGITTNCGFLSIFQKELAKDLEVPVATSSLMQVPMIAATLPPKRQVGIVTVSKESLTPEHLAGAGVPGDTPVFGTPADGVFAGTLLNDRLRLDVEAARREVVETAVTLRRETPDLGAIVLECTNMDPYAADIRQATGCSRPFHQELPCSGSTHHWRPHASRLREVPKRGQSSWTRSLTLRRGFLEDAMEGGKEGLERHRVVVRIEGHLVIVRRRTSCRSRSWGAPSATRARSGYHRNDGRSGNLGTFRDA